MGVESKAMKPWVNWNQPALEQVKLQAQWQSPQQNFLPQTISFVRCNSEWAHEQAGAVTPFYAHVQPTDLT